MSAGVFRFAIKGVQPLELGGKRPSFEEALGWGYERFGLEPFYVKQINDKAHTTHFMRGVAE